MPQITVTADRDEGTVTWRERINASDFESKHFAAQLVQRLGWAVNDAHEVERDADRRPLTAESAPTTESASATVESAPATAESASGAPVAP